MRATSVLRCVLCLGFLLPAGCGGQGQTQDSRPAANPFGLDSEPHPEGQARPERRTSRQGSTDSADRGETATSRKPHAVSQTGTQDPSSQTTSPPGRQAALRQPNKAGLIEPVVDAGQPADKDSIDSAKVEHPLVGQLAPNAELDRVDGTRFRLSDYRSESVVVLDFWTTWCQPCVKALPVLSRVADEYRDVGVVFCSINVEEELDDVRDFLRQHRLAVSAALDRDGKVADAFAVEQFPTLVLIDKSGVVRNVHVGEVQSLATVLKAEIEVLLDGKELVSSAPGSRVQQPDADGSGIAGDRTDSADPPEIAVHEPANYILALESGRSIDIGSVFRREGQSFERRLSNVMEAGRHVRVNYESGKPSVFVGRIGSRLHGPTVAFYESGATMAFLNYRRGKRDGTIFTWDRERRPVVFEQYDEGKRDGLRCLFKACSSECRDGHIWLLEEWQDGKLADAHLVPNDDEPVPLELSVINAMRAELSDGDQDASAAAGRPVAPNASENSALPARSIADELKAAVAELGDYELTLERGEWQLSQSLVQYNRLEIRQAQAARARAYAQAARRMSVAMRPRSLRIRACVT